MDRRIDRLALSRRRLLGAGLFAALSALAGGGAEAKPTRTPRPSQTPEPPTETSVPTDVPTEAPTDAPTDTPEPTATGEPTEEPTATDAPTQAPTDVPTATPAPTDTATAPATATKTPTATATNTATPTKTPTATATATQPPASVSSVLVSWYRIRRDGDVPYQIMAYRPRQFRAGFAYDDPNDATTFTVTNPAAYAGFDVLTTPNVGGIRADANADWLTVGLHRPARVGIVWRWDATLPTWLASGWTRGTDVAVSSPRWGNEAFRTYWKDVPAGDLVLGASCQGIGGARNTYWVLLAEQGGVPSGDPAPGIAPNQRCPFHPNLTWHPHIDPVSWCYYGHEHGTNPASLGLSWDPTFGRAAAAAGMTENDQGFKLMGWRQNGVRWIFGMHQGTSGAGRLCVRHHTTILAAWDDASGNRLLDLQWMGDYGAAVRNNPPDTCIFRPECPDQCGNFPGVRQISVRNDGGTGYEPWRVALEPTTIGLVGSPLFNTTDPVTICDQVSPCVLVEPDPPGQSGSRRFYQGNGFGVLNPPRTGEFWTDPMATAFRQAGDPDAVRQWIAPGLVDLRTQTNKVFDVDGFGRIGTPSQDDILSVNPTAREGSIPVGGPN